MRVYVIRHGESETNVKKRWTGWLDVQLTDKGREDARKAGELLKGISFDKIFTSDLTRAIETAKIAIPGCTYETTPLMREINVGRLEYTLIADVTKEQWARVPQYGYQDFGGENQREFYDRILQMRKNLEQMDCETVALFSHGGWLCGLLDTVLETRVPRKNYLCGNCTVGIFDFTNGTWKLHSWMNLA